MAVDLWVKRFLPAREEKPFEDLCRDCGCEEHGVFRSALTHTVQIFFFLFLINLVLGLGMALIGEEALSKLLLSGSVFQPLLAALVGFLPNCAASVLLTQLYLTGDLSFGAAVGRAVHRRRAGSGGPVAGQPPAKGKPGPDGGAVRGGGAHRVCVQLCFLRSCEKLEVPLGK